MNGFRTTAMMYSKLQNSFDEIGSLQAPETHPNQLKSVELRWGFGFAAMLLYLFVEYMRLSAQYPIFQAIDIGKVTVAIGFLGWIVSPRVAQKGSAVNFADIVLILFVLTTLASACLASYQNLAWMQVLDTVRWAMIYFLISRIVVSTWRLKIFIFLLLLLNLKMAQFAIRHFHTLKDAGMDAKALAKFGVGAGSGFFGNAGDFGVAMAVVLPLAGMLILGVKKWAHRGFLFACFLGFAGAILVCGSRGAVVGAIIAALVAWARNPRRLGGVVLFLLFIPGIVYVLPEASKARFESAVHYKEDHTVQNRFQFWTAGLRMYLDHPVLGVGPANFPPNYMLKYAQPGDDQGAWVPHSIYIEALSELGTPGIILFSLLVASSFRLNASTRKYLLEMTPGKQKEFEHYLAMALDMALVGYLVSGAFLTVLYYPHLWVVLGMSAGLNTAIAVRRANAASLATEQPDEKLKFAEAYQVGH